MNNKPDQIQFTALLKSKGLKVTPGRLKVLSLLSALHTPLSADDVYKKLKSTQIDRATVYRMLSSFAKLNIVRRIDLHTGSEQFELNHDHHHHLVCTNCGTLEDFKNCTMENKIRKILKESTFSKIDTHSLELFGVCKKCSK